MTDVKGLPPEQRLTIYQGLSLAAIADVSAVSDQELQILSWGFYRDHEMRELVGDQNYNAWFNTTVQAVKSQQDMGAIWELVSADRVEQEGLQIPLTTLALLGAWYGGPALAGATTGFGGTATGLRGAAQGSATASSLVAQAAKPAVLLASKISGVIPSSLIRTVARVGAGTTLATGVPLTVASVFDQVTNMAETEAAELDAMAEADAQRQAYQVSTWADQVADLDPYGGFRGAEPEGISDEDWQRAVAAAQGPGRDPQNPEPGLTYERPSGQGQPETPPQASGSGQVSAWDPSVPPPTSGDIDPNLDNPYVGYQGLTIPEGYRAVRQGSIRGPDIDWSWGDPETGTGFVPNYRESDFDLLEATLTEAEILRFQDRMVRAGYMNPDNVAYGLLDASTQSTLQRVLYESNLNGEMWQIWSQKLAIAGDERQRLEDEEAKKARLAAIGPFQRRTYLEPDYATLAVRSDAAVEQQLGRPINGWEKQLLVDQQYEDARAGFEATEQARLMDYRAQVRAVEEGLETGDTFGGGTVAQVDEAARFKQTFDKLFDKELARREKTLTAEQRSNTLMAGLNNAMGAIGGR